MPLSESLQIRLLELTTEIVVAAVQSGTVQRGLIPDFIASVFDAMASANQQSETAKPIKPRILIPAVSVKRSVTPDYIVCLEDGKHFKSMRGHLRKLGMTPEQYRERWGLPSDYPMVAPNYAARRSAMALRNGLGKAHSDKQSSSFAKKRQ